jgi:signal transduction histidine kinase
LSSFFSSVPIAMGIVELNGDEVLHISENPKAEHVASEHVRKWIGRFRQSQSSKTPILFDQSDTCHDGVSWGAVAVNFIGIGMAGLPRFSYAVLDVTDRKRSEVRNMFLEKASTSISAPLEYGDAIGRLVANTVPDFTDVCIVDVEVGLNKLRRIAVAHKNPELENVIREHLSKYPPRFDLPHPIVGVLKTGSEFFQARFEKEVLDRIAYNSDHLELLKGMNIRSAIAVPIRGRVGILGAMTFAITDGEREFDSKDVEIANELAWRAAIALENEHLYSKAMEAIRLRDEFLSVVSHDLKNPLSAVRLNAQLLIPAHLERNCVDLASKVGHMIQEAVEVMFTLVNDLLDVGKIDEDLMFFF